MLVRLCRLPRRPSDELGLDLSPIDHFRFNMTVLMAAELEITVKVNEVTSAPETTAEVVTANLLSLLTREN